MYIVISGVRYDVIGFDLESCLLPSVDCVEAGEDENKVHPVTFTLAKNIADAVKATQQFYQHNQEENPDFFVDAVGDYTLVQWALGNACKGYASLFAWIDERVKNPELCWATGDERSRTVGTISTDLLQVLGDNYTIAYKI